MKKLLDLLNEIEEKEVLKPVEEEKPSAIDEVGKFFVVKKPKKGMTKEDLMYEADVFAPIMVEETHGVYKQKSDASRVATEVLKAYEEQLKEMESAMNDFRSAKKEIEEKKKVAKEKIMKLK